MGTHWNLEGYWRGRINRHSQFQEPTIEDSLNKTYTMQLYYDNPNSRWVAGVGRLYLPWAVSLDTIDGGYLGRKFPMRNTSGVFRRFNAGPEFVALPAQPEDRRDFHKFRRWRLRAGFIIPAPTGAALTSIRWKLDRPYAFFENEISYKGKVSAYHSLIVDSPKACRRTAYVPAQASATAIYLALSAEAGRVFRCLPQLFSAMCPRP